MAALDTNVLVRFLVRDDAAQRAAAEDLLRRCLDAGETLFVPVTVALELEWVFMHTPPNRTHLLRGTCLIWQSSAKAGAIRFSSGLAWLTGSCSAVVAARQP